MDSGTAMAEHTLPVLEKLRGGKLRRDIAVANFGLHFSTGQGGAPFLGNLRALSKYTKEHKVPPRPRVHPPHASLLMICQARYMQSAGHT